MKHGKEMEMQTLTRGTFAGLVLGCTIAATFMGLSATAAPADKVQCGAQGLGRHPSAPTTDIEQLTPGALVTLKDPAGKDVVVVSGKPASDPMTVEVKFKDAFSQIPVVVATVAGDSTDTNEKYNQMFAVTLKKVTPTGFTALVTRTYQGGADVGPAFEGVGWWKTGPTLCWIANPRTQ